MLIQDFLERSADRTPDQRALVCEGESFSYRTIESMSNRIAHALSAQGIRRGDRVVIHLNNSLETVVSIWGTLKAGAVFVLIHKDTKPNQVANIVKDCGASALIERGGDAAVSNFNALASAAPALKFGVFCGSEPVAGEKKLFDYHAFVSAFPDHRPSRINEENDLACLVYTSGSTGEPKGVMTEHRNAVFVAQSIIQYLEHTSEDVILSALPLSFTYGLYQLLMAAAFAGTLVLEDSFAMPGAILETMAREKVTGFPGVPTMFAMLLRLDLSAFDLSSLRLVTNAGAALATEQIGQLRRKFPHARFFSMYGLTETSRTLYLPPEQLDHRPDSVGMAIPGTEVWIEDETGVRLPPGNLGELVIRGPHVMRGYWGDEEATVARFRPGRFPGERVCHSGDLFRMDEEGFLFFVSRKDDIIKSRGEKVAPKEIENVLYQLPGVLQAAVIGVPHPVMGAFIKAFLVTGEGAKLTTAQVQAHCREHLEDFKVPREVELRDVLPVTLNGKIQKRSLI